MATVVNIGGRPRTAPRTAAFYALDRIAARRGISIRKLAVAAGVSHNALYTMQDPRLSLIEKVAAALEMPPSSLAAKIIEAKSSG